MKMWALFTVLLHMKNDGTKNDRKQRKVNLLNQYNKYLHKIKRHCFVDDLRKTNFIHTVLGAVKTFQ